MPPPFVPMPPTIAPSSRAGGRAVAALRGRADGFVPVFGEGARRASRSTSGSDGPVVAGSAAAGGSAASNRRVEAGWGLPEEWQRTEGSVAVEASEAVEHPHQLAPLAAYLDDPTVTDVFVNGSRGLWADRGRGAIRDPLWRADEDAVRELALGLIGLGGRHIDEASPAVDVRLASGMRIHAVLPPVSTGGTTLSIRIPRVVRPTLDDLEQRGMFRAQPEVIPWLRSLVADRVNVLVTGAAGSGKTTLLAALLAEAPASDRIVTIEDVAELTIAHPHHVALEARQANLEGAGGIGLARLVREALRMRPDRLVLGECRGDEVRELLAALNTGHDGGAGTVHASGLREIPARLEALGALAGLDDAALARQAVSAIGAVVHVARAADGTRALVGAGRLGLADGRLTIGEHAPWRS